PPALVFWKALAVIGKSVLHALPTAAACPAASTAIPPAPSKPDPPRYVEYTNFVPVGLTFVTNALWHMIVAPLRPLQKSPPLNCVWKAPGVVGKSADPVSPARYALP